jgi:hypothetical protein
MTPLLEALIQDAARNAGLDGDLVEAFVRVESDGDRYAWKPEPRYRFLWDVKRQRPFRALTDAEIASAAPPADFPYLVGSREQEWTGQRASWGLLQVMGAVAREEGFTAAYLPELTDPAANLIVGCRHLRGLLRWSSGDVAQAAAGFNAGRGGWKSDAGQRYSAKVLSALADVRARKPQ